MENQESKWDQFKRRAKQHVKENKKTYFVSGVTGVICIAGTYFLTKGRGGGVNIALNWKGHVLQSINGLERRGHPGNRIRCVETGEIFASQNRAAKAYNIAQSNLSNHLSGRQATVGGYTFEILGEAIA